MILKVEINLLMKAGVLKAAHCSERTSVRRNVRGYEMPQLVTKNKAASM